MPPASEEIGTAPTLLYLPDADYATLDAGRGSIETFEFATDGSGRYRAANSVTSSFRWTGDAATALTLRFPQDSAGTVQTLDRVDVASGKTTSVSCVNRLREIRIERGVGSSVSRHGSNARSCADAALDQVLFDRSTRYWSAAGDQGR